MVNEIYDRIARLTGHGDEAVLVTVVDKEGSAPAAPGAKMLVCADGSTVGTVGGGQLESLAALKALELMKQKQSLLVTYSLVEGGVATEGEPTGMLCGGKISLFYDYLGYQACIYIFGAGHVGRAVARHLGDLDYYITMLDHRQEMKADTEGVDRLIVTQYEEALEADRVPAGAFFLIATPSHAFDYVALRRIFTSDWRPRYVGMLASRRKAQALVQQLLEDLGEEVDLSPLYAPVGLDLGGRSPEDIAIAIAAEIQALQHDKVGHRHLRLEADHFGLQDTARSSGAP